LARATPQSYNLNDFGVRPADVVIEPDVTGYDMTEFGRAREIAAIGESTATRTYPENPATPDPARPATLPTTRLLADTNTRLIGAQAINTSTGR